MIENNETYSNHAENALDYQTMEALAANAEEGLDMDQVLRHNQYIGWVLAIARSHDIALIWEGGNKLTVPNTPPDLTIHLVIPMPPEDWKP